LEGSLRAKKQMAATPMSVQGRWVWKKARHSGVWAAKKGGDCGGPPGGCGDAEELGHGEEIDRRWVQHRRCCSA
jgi:hypothetical protein